LVARDLAATVAQCEAVFGVSVAYRDPQVAEFGLANALMPIGDQFLEVISPIRPDTAAGRHLERRGDSAYMIILQTEDLARDRARVERLGVRIVWQANYPDVRAIHLHPKDIGAAIVSLDQPIPPESWRWAGPNWKKHVPANGARQILDATIEARDPKSMARRWAEVLGLDGKTSHLALASGNLHFVGGDADGIVAYRLVVSRREQAIAAAHSRGLAVAQNVVTLCGTRFELAEAA
jgi:hypothetical protein